MVGDAEGHGRSGAGSAGASKVAYPERESPSGSIVHSVGEPLVAVPAAYTMLAIGCQASDVAGPGSGTGSSVVWVIAGAANTRTPPVVEPCSLVAGSGPVATHSC